MGIGFHKLFGYAIEEAIQDDARKGCFVVNTATELIPNDGNMQATLQDHMDNMEELFTGHIQKGIDNGEIDASKNAKDIGLLLFTFYSGFRVVSKIDTDAEKLHHLVKTTLSILD